MNGKDNIFWGIHAGRTGDADSYFLKNNRIALGWSNIQDLLKIPADREAFKHAVVVAYPEKKPGAIPNNAGQLYRFVYELKNGDFIIYPSKSDRQVHLGRISGDYFYDPKSNPNYPHIRPVEWLKHYPRSYFSQGALYEIGSAMTFFLVKNYAEEFRASLEGKPELSSVIQDESVGAIAEDIEETTQDFIIKRLAQEVKGHPFAEFIAHLLTTMGYRTRVSPEGPDGGVDIIAHRDELGFEPPIIKVQVKSTEGSISDPIVSALYGKVGNGEYGLLVTLGTFTSQAKNFAKSRTNLRLIDGQELVTLILEHYEDFDSRYKGLLPLRRVFIPELLEDLE